MAQQPFYPRVDEDDEYAFRYGRLLPGEQIGVDMARSQRTAERGAENVVRALAGSEPAEGTQRQQAGAELRALASKVAPGTPEFYKAAAAIFQKYNMVAEAEKMQQNLHALEIGKGEMDPVMKMQRTYDELKKRFDAGDKSVEPAMKALERRIAVAGTSRATPASDPEFIKLLDAYEAALEAGQGDRADAIKRAIDAWLASKAKTGADMTEYQKARLKLDQEKEDRVATDKRDSSNRAIAAIVSALQGTVRGLDEEIDAATKLLNHPGRAGIVGKFYGGTPLGILAAKNDASAGAAAYYRTLEGQTFIRALQDLKATSKTGASGLGQLTEVEGNKIQQAKTSIHRQQPDEQFVRTLTAYIAGLKRARDAGAGELTKAGKEVPTPPITSDAPVRADPRAVIPPAAAPAKRTFKSTQVK